jgi:DNA-binding transcriptional MerR regulator
MREDTTRGENADTNREVTSESGWVTTLQAAKALGVTARTVRWHIEKGNIEAIPQGEGVRRTWLVSVDSLQAFRVARQPTAELPRSDRANAESADITPDIPGDTIRELADRLVEEASKATEYRLRLELTEQAQTTLEEELEAERIRRAEAERERDELRTRLEELQETPQAPETTAEEPERTEPPDRGEGPQEATERRSWWRRFFGIGTG